MLFEQMTVFTVSVAVRSSAFCTVKIASTLILGAKMPLRSDSFCNMGGGDEVWSFVAPLQGWSRHLGHSWSRKEYPGGPEKCWHITCFEPEIFFWKMRGMFSQLLTKKATWQKSTSVPILVIQCSISDIVSTSRSWLHLILVELFVVYFLL